MRGSPENLPKSVKGQLSKAKFGIGKGYLREIRGGKLHCSIGGEWKYPSEFPPDKRRTYGRGSACRFHRNLRVANARLPKHAAFKWE